MGKRILAWLLCVAMIASFVPASVFAEGAEVTQSPKAGTHQTTGHTCDDAGCGEANWLPWPTDGSRPTNGHYYLTGNVQLEGMVSVKAGEKLHVCLNGFVMTAAAGKRLMSSSEAGAEIVITDCTADTDENGVYQAGALTGGVNTGESGAGAVYVATNAVLKLYNGRITGNISKDDDAEGGAIVLGTKGTGGVPGGRFYMYGGEISNNTAYKTNGKDITHAGAIDANAGSYVEINGGMITGNTGSRGGAIYANAATVSVKNAKITGNTGGNGAIALYDTSTLTMENVTMTGNTATNGSAIYATSSAEITIKDSEITGNTGTSTNSAGRCAAVYTDGGGNKVTLSGKVIIVDNNVALAGTPGLVMSATKAHTVYVKDLKDGSRVDFLTSGYEPTETTDASEVLMLDTQPPELWQSGWIKYYSKSGVEKDVGLVNGQFVFGHYHGTQAYTKLEDPAQLTKTGHYYLADDLTLDAKALLKNKNVTVDVCLNGHSLSPADGAQLLEIQGAKNALITFDDCTAYTGADGVYHAGQLTGADSGVDGGLLKVGTTDVVTLKEGKITNNKGVKGGAMILNGTFVLEGGEISNNQATANGGAVFVNTSGVFRMTGGVVKNNQGVNGGAVYSGGMVEITGGKITGNTATENGGAISLKNGLLKDVAITGNTAQGAAVVLTSASGALELAGATNITDNSTGNLYLIKDFPGVTVNNLTGKVGVTMADDRIDADQLHITGTLADGIDPSGRFTSDDNGYDVELKNKQVVLTKKSQTPPATEPSTPSTPTTPNPEHEHCLCGKDSCTEHTTVEYLPWSDAKKLPTSGNYYLTVDVKISSRAGLKNNDQLNLCLNGHTITTTDKRAFYLYDSATLRISDCATTPGKITGATSGAIVSDGSCDGALIELYGGILTGNENTSTGGAVLVMGKAAFKMYGGTITGNALHCKLALDDQGKPTLDKDGAQKVTSTRGGGAVGVYAEDSAFYMYGGEISGNETTKVTYLDKDGKSVETGGNGGAVFVEEGTAYLYGGKITGNKADRNGGAVYGTEDASITVGGTIQITGNTVGVEANNLQVPEGKKLKVEKLDKTAKIGVNAVEPGQFTESCDDYTENFVSDNAKRNVTYISGALHLSSISNHKHCFCNGASDQCKHESVTYTEWTNPKKLPTSGNYYLAVDVKISSRAGLKNNDALNLCLNGHTITTTDKRAFYLYDSATLRITDCATTPGKITGATSGAIVADSSCDGALIELYGGILTGNENTSTGGAVQVMGKAAFKMYGGTITGNALHCKLALDDQGKPVLDKDGAQKVTSNRGGGAVGVYNEDSAFYMYGGEISGNETTKVTYLDKDGKSVETGGNGGAVFVEKGTAYLYGGKITGNKAGRNGGAVYGTENASITLGGTIQITGNTAGGEANNLQIPEGKKLKVEKLDKTAKIGVNAADLGKFTESCDDYTENFVSDNAKRYVVYQKGALYLMAFSNHKHCFCNGASDQCKHETVTYAEWTNPKALPTSGNYYLAVDVTISKRAGLKNDDELNLCLNGHTITTTDKRAFYLYDNATLRITDCAKTPGKITGANSGAIVADSSCDGALIELYNGILTGNENATLGGAVDVMGKTTFNMYGGTITGNAVHCKLKVDEDGKPVLDKNGAQTVTSNRGGGGVGLYGKDTAFHMYGGEITGNKTTKAVYLDKNGKQTNGGGLGGGIYAEKGAVYIHGGKVTNNSTDRSGGGIYGQEGLIQITGGEISNNIAGDKGAGLYASTKSKVLMTGGKVTGNKSTSSGAGVVLSGKNVEMNFTGGEVSANSGASGGGILVQSAATLNLKGGKVTKNNASGSGGGIYVSSDSFLNMSDGMITGNQAKSDGGGATLVRCEAKITGGTISNNHTEVTGGGIRVTGSKLTASGLRMVGNTAKKNGGAIVTGSSSQTQNGVKVPYYVTVNLYNCYFANNTCESSGGAMLVQSKGTVFNMTNCNFTGNKATSGGGAFYISTNVTFSMKGGKITDNYAAAGGAVRLNNCKANFVDVLIQNNEAKNGGGIYSKGANCIWSATNVQILDNKLLNGSGGGIYINAATVELNNVKVSGNESPEKSGGGIYVTGRSKLTMNGGEVSKNRCLTLGGGIYVARGSLLDFTDVDFLYNHNEGNGGAINCGGGLTFTGCKFVGNTSNGNGGAIATNMSASQWVQDLGGVFLTDCEFTDNSCALQGGALYIHRGGPAYLTKVTLTKNKAGTEGGAIYDDGIMELTDVTVEENTSGGTGYAVYIGPGEWDGHSYTTGRRKLVGDVIIQNNDGGDMYLAEGAVASVYGATLGDKAVVNVTLCDGVLTQRILGIYHYEGEGLSYVLTAGDRSITEPMAPQGAAAETEETGENVLLYVCIGVFAIAVAAVVVLLAMKKKKAGKPAEKVNKE